MQYNCTNWDEDQEVLIFTGKNEEIMLFMYVIVFERAVLKGTVGGDNHFTLWQPDLYLNLNLYYDMVTSMLTSANQLLACHLTFAPLSQVDEWCSSF